MKDIAVPTDVTGYVYIIVSTVDLGVFYIGSAASVVERLRRHNQGLGGMQSSNPRYRPWGLLAYVTGFGGNKQKYVAFEEKWIFEKILLLRNSQSVASVEAVVNIGKALTADYNHTLIIRMKNSDLLIVEQ